MINIRECKIISKGKLIRNEEICQLLIENLNQIEGSVMDADAKKQSKKFVEGPIFEIQQNRTKIRSTSV